MDSTSTESSSSARRTPGPWITADAPPDPAHDIARVREMGYANGIAIRSSTRLPSPFPLTQGIANARLIAAAPEMLAALRKIAAECDPRAVAASPQAMRNAMIRAANHASAVLAAAEGR